ncbi:MAG: topoisomerase [Pseudomonas sp.]|nr:topoisomerase [Pseudomonas sp.]
MAHHPRSLARTFSRWTRALRARLTALMQRRESAAPLDDAAVEHPPAINAVQAEKPAEKPEAKKRARKPKTKNAPPVPDVITPKCPHCRKPMVIKTARTGRNAGDFWGCADYPKCRGIRPIFKTTEPTRRG